MKLLVGFILIFCTVETVRCSGRRSPSRSVWNYLKEFAWDHSSTDTDNDRGPVVPLQVRITPIRQLTSCITLHMYSPSTLSEKCCHCTGNAVGTQFHDLQNDL